MTEEEGYTYKAYRQAYMRGYKAAMASLEKKKNERPKRPDSHYEDIIDIERD
jgi:hypothetical protein